MVGDKAFGRPSADLADARETPAAAPGGGSGAARVLRVLPGWVVRDVFVPVAVTRGVLLTVALLASALLPRDQGQGKFDYSPHAWINVWSRWDALWYLGIAEHGYQNQPGPGAGEGASYTDVAFFPLYPALVKIVSLVFGQHPSAGRILAAGIVVANLALLVVIGYLVALVRLDFDKATAARAGLYLLVFPSSLFLSAVYTESLFLAFTIAAFYHARRQQWWIVGALGAAAALTRLNGLLLVVPLAYEYLAQRRFHPSSIRADILALGLIPAGFAAYPLYLGWRFGDPLAFARAQAAWGRAPVPPWEMLREFFNGPLVIYGPHHSLLDLGFTVLFLALSVAAWRLTRPSYALFSSLTLLLTVSSLTLVSQMRFGLALFPTFMVLALAGRCPWFDRAYVIAATALGSLFMAMFALWYWVV